MIETAEATVVRLTVAAYLSNVLEHGRSGYALEEHLEELAADLQRCHGDGYTSFLEVFDSVASSLGFDALGHEADDPRPRFGVHHYVT